MKKICEYIWDRVSFIGTLFLILTMKTTNTKKIKWRSK